MEVESNTLIADRYRVKRKLGEGNMGAVYVALDTKFNAQVALKLAHAEGNDFDTFRRRFRREAEIGYLLGKAPGFVRALDWGELTPGESLYMALDLIREAKPLDLSGPLPARLRRMARAASLVARLHKFQVVHRDLKPDNFLVDGRGGIHLSDFGTAKWLGKPREQEGAADESGVGLTQPGVLLGTPLYMPPEQFEDPSSLTTQADVYALGVMLYQCLTGRYPFTGTNPIQIMSNQVMARHGDNLPPTPIDLVPTLDRRLSDLAVRATSLTAADRPSSEEFFRALDGLGNTRRARAAPSPAAAAPPRPAERSPAPPPVAVATPPPPQTRAELEERLGLDGDGFAAWSTWRTLFNSLGRGAFLKLLGDRPALRVTAERPLNGATRYEGKVALVCSREHLRDPKVLVGRTREADLAIQLPSISKAHATFTLRRGRWFLADLNSSNGTELGGRTVRRDELELDDRALIQFGQHITFAFLLPDSLCEALS